MGARSPTSRTRKQPPKRSFRRWRTKGWRPARKLPMADAPTIGRKGLSLDLAVLFRRYAALAALILLLAFNFAVTPNFASWQTLNVNLTQVATIVIVSVGSLMAISGALAPLIFLSSFGRSYPGLGDALAFVVPVAVAGLFGA